MPVSSSSSVRESWGSTASFFLACVGYAVGLGNIWRFPYLCFKSGGGAFLVPYLLLLLSCGVPLLLMEILAGQYTRRGPVGAIQKMCPLLKGAGVASVVISFWLCSYYNVILSWTLVYLFSSVSSIPVYSSDDLPWTGCGNKWNTEECWDVGKKEREEEQEDNVFSNVTKKVSSAQEFYDRRVLGMSSGLEEMGGVRWELLGCLALAWVVVYFSLWKSVRVTGKVVYFTATVPYLLLSVFLVRSVTLPGAWEGLRFFLEPRWDKMAEPKVWVYAAAQVFNSIGIGFGSLVAFASYNRFHHRSVIRDACAVAAADAATCLLCGLCVFSTLGALASDLGLEVEEVAADGPGLLFVVFPHAIARLPMPGIWATIFFSMLLLLGVDSQFATVEVVVTSFKDLLHSYGVSFLRHEFLVLLICTSAFLLGLPLVFNGGVFLFQLVDYYAAALSLMAIAFCEAAAALWGYGAKRLAANAMDMTGRAPPRVLVLCWRFLSPPVVLAIWACDIFSYQAPNCGGGSCAYPWWGLAMGWAVAATSLAAIPAGAAHAICKANEGGRNIFHRLRISLRSTIHRCPCGCDMALDENFEAHCGESREELLFGGKCPEEEGLTSKIKKKVEEEDRDEKC